MVYGLDMSGWVWGSPIRLLCVFLLISQIYLLMNKRLFAQIQTLKWFSFVQRSMYLSFAVYLLLNVLFLAASHPFIHNIAININL